MELVLGKSVVCHRSYQLGVAKFTVRLRDGSAPYWRTSGTGSSTIIWMGALRVRKMSVLSREFETSKIIRRNNYRHLAASFRTYIIQLLSPLLHSPHA